jgi:hypothetical protein
MIRHREETVGKMAFEAHLLAVLQWCAIFIG